MKRITTLFFLLFTIPCFSQTDKNGNPIFNSISTGDVTLKDFKIHSNYYTIKNNIENSGSSVYISTTPTLDQILNFATVLPSDFFLITKGQNMINMVIIINKPSRKFIVIDPNNRNQTEFECSLEGDLTENRAKEIIKENYDPKAKLEGDNLYFNGRNLKVISNRDIMGSILDLIEKRNLTGGDISNLKVLSKEDLKIIVLKESKEGGKLDFFTAIKGKEMDGIQIKPGVFSTQIGVALYNWGRANFDLGTNSLEDALEFWTEFKGRQPNQREKEYIKLGFNRGLEK